MNRRNAFLIFILCAILERQVYAAHNTFFQEKQVAKTVAKKKTKVGKFIQSIFKHNDSAKQARKFIHQQHRKLKGKISPTFAKQITNKIGTPLKTSKDVKLAYEVFGFYPHWEKDYYKEINFSLLSTVAYFSYEVDPKTGNAISTYDWETTPLIDSIKAQQGKKILLTVSNFGIYNNKKFLKNLTAIDTLIDNLIKLLAKRQADGICLDFEGVSKNEKSKYTSFLLNLSSRIKNANKNYQIYMTVPNVDWSKAIDFKAIDQAIDCFVIMGYDYYGKGSKVAGPIAPLESGKTWEPYNLTNSVAYYTKNIASSKIILALPTYGTLWETQNLNIKSKVKKYIGSRTYSYIKSNIENNESVYIEPISQSAYSVYKIKGTKNVYRQCWFENDVSFRVKTKLIKDKKLRGLGIWALGYDKGYNDFWKVINKELVKPVTKDSVSSNVSITNNAVGNTTDSTAQKQPTLITKIANSLGITNPNSKINNVEKKLGAITNYKTILLYVMSFVLFFSCIGFVIAMLSPNTRDSFFNNEALKRYYTIMVLTLVVVVFRMQHWITDSSVLLITGFLLGAYAFYLINKYVERRQKDLP